MLLSQTIYIDDEILFIVFKEMTLDAWIIFISESQFWYKDHLACLWLLCAFWGSEPMPFGGCIWGFDILLLISSKSRPPQLRLDQSWYRGGPSENCWYTYTDEILDILIIKLKRWK